MALEARSPYKSAYEGTEEYEKFMQAVIRARVHSEADPAVRLLRASKGSPHKTSAQVSPVMTYMEQVITDLVGQHGCRHSIAQIQRLRSFIDDVLEELTIVQESDERIELRRINSLRQKFIVLNTAAVYQDGELRWEFKDSRAQIHDKSQSVEASTSLPDISGGSSIFDKLYAPGSPSPKKGADSVESRDEERRESAYVVKCLRARLKKSEAAGAAAEESAQTSLDRAMQMEQALSKRNEQNKALRDRLDAAKRDLAEARAAIEAGKARERSAEAEGRSEAEGELRQKTKAVLRQERQLEKMAKESSEATTLAKVLGERLQKSKKVVEEAEQSKEGLWNEARRLKGALSDAKALVRVLQEKGPGHADVQEYGLRELAEKDRIRSEYVEASEQLAAAQQRGSTLSSELGESQREAANLRESLSAARLRGEELDRQVFDLKLQLGQGKDAGDKPPAAGQRPPQRRPPPVQVSAKGMGGTMAAAADQPLSSSSSSENVEYGEDFDDDDEEEDEEEEDGRGR